MVFLVHLHLEAKRKRRQNCILTPSMTSQTDTIISVFHHFFCSVRSNGEPRSKGLADIDLYSSFRMNMFDEGI